MCATKNALLLFDELELLPFLLVLMVLFLFGHPHQAVGQATFDLLERLQHSWRRDRTFKCEATCSAGHRYNFVSSVAILIVVVVVAVWWP